MTSPVSRQGDRFDRSKGEVDISKDSRLEPSVTSSSYQQLRCTSSASVPMMSSTGYRAAVPEPTPLSPVKFNIGLDGNSAATSNNRFSKASLGGMNVASGLCSALTALSANGSTRPQPRYSPLPATRAESGSYRTEVNFSPVSNCMAAASEHPCEIAALPVGSRDTNLSSLTDEIGRTAQSVPSVDVETSTSRTLKDVKAVIADRRSSFFNEVPKSPSLPPRSASQYSVPRSQPLNLVVERSKRFEQAIKSAPSIDDSSVSEINKTDLSLDDELLMGGISTCPGTTERCEPIYCGDRASITKVMPGSAACGELNFDRSCCGSLIDEETTLNESMPQQYARLEPSPERILAAASDPTTGVLPRASPRPYVTGNRGVGGTKMTGVQERGVAPMRAVNSMGNLDDRINNAKLQEFSGNISLSDEPLTSAISESLTQTTPIRDDDPKRSVTSVSELKSDLCAKTEAMVTHGAKPSEGASKFSSSEKSGSGTNKSGSGKKAAHWTLANKMHGSHSPGARPKKASNEHKTDSTSSSSPKQKETWKGKVAKTFKRYGSGPVLSTPRPVEVAGAFGVPLEACQPSTFNEFVPSIVEICTRVVEEKGLLNQGIYRVPGNTSFINQLVEELNKDPVHLCAESDKWQDVNLVSSLLKLFFRKLPDALITDDLYEAVIAANRTENSERRMLKLKKLLHELPEHNFETFHYMAQHLNKITMHEDVNKMDAHNLAIMFGPTFVRPQDDSMVAMVKDMTGQCRIVESIIVHCDWFFSSWDEDVNVPVDEESEDATPISTMNQELLAKAESLAAAAQHHQSSSPPAQSRDPVRYKELVSTIISAANRKIRHREKGKHGGVGSGSTGDLTQVGVDYEGGLGKKESSSVTESEAAEEKTVEYTISRSLKTETSQLPSDVSFEVTRYAAYHFDTSSTITSTENAKPSIMRRTHSSESLLEHHTSGVPGSGGGKIYYQDFTIRTAPKLYAPYGTSTQPPQLSPQLLCQVHLKRHQLMKQQFLQQQQQRIQIQGSAWHSGSGTRAVRAVYEPQLTIQGENDGAVENETPIRRRDM